MIQEGGTRTPQVSIRVKNASQFDFECVSVRFPGTDEPTDFGPIPSGGLSAFTRVNVAYRYAQIRVVAASQEWVFQPIDYVGEQPLEVGRYTYVLGVSDNVLTIDLNR
jgi:hypothetical protein